MAERANGDLKEIRINGELLLWPAGMDTDPLLRIAAEQSPKHPHRYDWGNTQLGSGEVVLDIGACEGMFSVYAASKGARVIAVEPSVTMSKVIERLFSLRQLPRPTVVGKLIGLRKEIIHFCEDRTNIAASRISATAVAGSYPVEVTPLDDLVDSLHLDRLDFIKCDAEGADFDIVRGAEGTLRRFRPKIAITTYHEDDHYRLISEYLRGLGYHVRGKGFIYVNGVYRVVMIHASPNGRIAD
jgi:FkbM family methyltransferase